MSLITKKLIVLFKLKGKQAFSGLYDFLDQFFFSRDISLAYFFKKIGPRKNISRAIKGRYISIRSRVKLR
jgi:hypothetical protein